MKKVLTKENIIIFSVIFVLSLLICFGYVKGHYSIDDYNIMNIGYERYSIENNLKEGRVIMYLIDQIALLINMDYNLFIILTVIIAILITSITIVLYYNEILKILVKVNKKEKILLLGICYVTFFNFMYLENLYFVESIVMSLSLLLYFLSAKLLVAHRKMLLVIALAVFANFCYNGIQCYYITLVFILSLLREKDNYKKIFINTLIAGLLIVAAVVINLIQIKLVCNVYNIENNRIESSDTILINLICILKYVPIIVVNTSQLFPKYLYLIFILICLLISILFECYNNKDKRKLKLITDEIFIMFISIMSCFCISIFSLSSFGNR